MANVELKQPIIQEIAAQVDGAETVVLVDYRGLTVAQDTELRAAMRDAGITYKVYKNTMMQRAFEGTEFEKLDPVLEGPSAIAISKDDATAPARLLAKYAKTMTAIEIKAGIVEGEFYDAEAMKAIAAIPSREELLGRLFGSMKSPIANFARVMNQLAEKGGAPKEEPKAEEPAPVEEAPKAEEPAPAAEEPKAEEPAPAAEEPKAEEPAPVEEAPKTEKAPAKKTTAAAKKTEDGAEEKAPAKKTTSTAKTTTSTAKKTTTAAKKTEDGAAEKAPAKKATSTAKKTTSTAKTATSTAKKTTSTAKTATSTAKKTTSAAKKEEDSEA